MDGLRELYQEVILDHGKRPRNRREIENAENQAKGYNPLCGDRVTVFVVLEDGRIADVSFQGDGCAISTASASMMTESLKGKTIEEAEAILGKVHDTHCGQRSRNARKPSRRSNKDDRNESGSGEQGHRGTENLL
jgi:nitrogen fixation NifU-like protein